LSNLWIWECSTYFFSISSPKLIVIIPMNYSCCATLLEFNVYTINVVNHFSSWNIEHFSNANTASLSLVDSKYISIYSHSSKCTV
jgi:hypothetical protein